MLPVSHMLLRVAFGLATLIALQLLVPLTLDGRAQEAQRRGTGGPCIDHGMWEAAGEAGKRGGATFRGCSEEEPPTYLGFSCKAGNKTISVSSELVFKPGPQGQLIPFAIVVDGQRHMFRATADNTGMYESLAFDFPNDHPVLKQLSTARTVAIQANSEAKAIHLSGARKALATMLRACGLEDGQGLDGDTSRQPRREAFDPNVVVVRDAVTGVMFVLPRRLAGKETRETHGLNWKSDDNRLDIDTLSFPAGRSLRSVYDKLKSKPGRRITRDEYSDGGLMLEGIDGRSSPFIVRVEQRGSQKRGLSIVYSRRGGPALSESAHRIAATMQAFPGAIAQLQQQQKKLASPKRCHLASADGSAVRVAARLWLDQSSARHPEIGTGSTINWEVSGRIDPDCRTPLYLVAAFKGRVRFAGEGFLAMPKGTPGPFAIKHEQGKARLFFPLHILDLRKGRFQVVSFSAGPLDVSWSLVEVPRLVDNPHHPEDFAIGQEIVAEGAKVDTVTVYRPGRPKVVVRDQFTVVSPKGTYRSKSGEFDLQVFDKYYRVLDARTGEQIIDRSGKTPNFSPGSRFLAAFVDDDLPLEVIDLYARKVIYRGEAGHLAWANGDTLFSPGTFIGGGAGRRAESVLNVQQSLVDNGGTLFPDLEYYKTSAEGWLLSVDIEGAIASVYDTTKRLGNDYHNGGRAWASLLDRRQNSIDLVKAAQKSSPACRRAPGEAPCVGAIQSAVHSALAAYAQKALISSERVGHAPQGIDSGSGLPWFSGKNRMALSLDCFPHDNGECGGSNLRALLVQHPHLPATRPPPHRIASADLRTIQARSTWSRTIKQTTGNRGVPERISRRLVALDVDLALGASTPGKAVKIGSYDYDKRADKVGFIRSRIARSNPAAARIIPDNDDNFRPKHYDHGCYSRTKRYADRSVGEDPMDSGAISRFMDLAGGGADVWLLTTECSNGASGRSRLFVLSALPGRMPRLLDLSHELRFQVGTGRMDIDPERFKGIGTYNVYSGTVGFGSWPTTIDKAQISLGRYLLAHGSWPGGRWALLFDLESHQVRTFIRNVENADSFGSIAITQDGRRLVQFNSDGQIFIYDTGSGKIILRGTETDDELVLYDDNGYYLSTPEGAHFVNVKFPGISGYNTVHQFARTLNRPDIIGDILAGRSPPPKPDLTPPPELSVKAEEATTGGARMARVSYLASSITGLKALRIFVDGRPAKEELLTDAEAKGAIEVALAPEARWISAVAVDTKSYESVPRGAALPGAVKADTSRLFAITVGTDTYNDTSIAALSAAKRDASAFAATLDQQKGTIYSEVVTVSLLDDADLRTNLPARIRDIAGKATRHDTIMLFVAGHGFRAKDGRFHLVTRRTQLQRLEETSLNWNEVAAAFAGIKARTIVFLDACRSGAAGESATNDEAVASLLERSLPITVIAASKGRQDSEETDKGGEFTNAVLRAIANRGVTDTNGNGAIELAEIYGAVKRDVVLATKGRQTPWLARNDMVGEVPLF